MSQPDGPSQPEVEALLRRAFRRGKPGEERYVLHDRGAVEGYIRNGGTRAVLRVMRFAGVLATKRGCPQLGASLLELAFSTDAPFAALRALAAEKRVAKRAADSFQ